METLYHKHTETQLPINYKTKVTLKYLAKELVPDVFRMSLPLGTASGLNASNL